MVLISFIVATLAALASGFAHFKTDEADGVVGYLAVRRRRIHSQERFGIYLRARSSTASTRRRERRQAPNRDAPVSTDVRIHRELGF